MAKQSEVIVHYAESEEDDSTEAFDPELETLFGRLLTFPQRERIAVADELYASIPIGQSPAYYADTDKLKAELIRRIEEMESGAVKGIPAEEVFASIRRKYVWNEKPTSFHEHTLQSVIETFGLTLTEDHDLFAGVPAVEPSEWLTSMLEESVTLARAMNTEKACSELIVAPVLTNVRLRNAERCSLHSGKKLKVDVDGGLTGPCDFLMSRSPLQMLLSPPIMLAIKTRQSDLNAGLGPCIAMMIGAVRHAGNSLGQHCSVFGAVTDGGRWKFLKLEGSVVAIDMRTYWIGDVAKILGIIQMIVKE